jgi:hypothetical protein
VPCLYLPIRRKKLVDCITEKNSVILQLQSKTTGCCFAAARQGIKINDSGDRADKGQKPEKTKRLCTGSAEVSSGLKVR